MYDVSLLVDHDVAIVPVFDLEDVADQRVGCHALDEIGTGLEEPDKERFNKHKVLIRESY